MILKIYLVLRLISIAIFEQFPIQFSLLFLLNNALKIHKIYNAHVHISANFHSETFSDCVFCDFQTISDAIFYMKSVQGLPKFLMPIF